MASGFFNGQSKTVQLNRKGEKFEFRIVILRGFENDEKVLSDLKEWLPELSRSGLEGAPVEIHVCDNRLNTIRVIGGD